MSQYAHAHTAFLALVAKDGSLARRTLRFVPAQTTSAVHWNHWLPVPSWDLTSLIIFVACARHTALVV